MHAGITLCLDKLDSSHYFEFVVELASMELASILVSQVMSCFVLSLYQKKEEWAMF